MPEMPAGVRLHILSNAGHHTEEDPEKVQEEFDRLIRLGYNAFLEEEQIKSLEGVIGDVYMVPALQGGLR